MQYKKIKFIIFLAITLVASLLISSIYLLVINSKKQNQISMQQSQISELEDKLNFYQNQKDENKDNKDSDYEIIIPEEN